MYMLRMRNVSRAVLGALLMLSCTAAAKADDFEKFREQAAARKKETIKMLTAAYAPSVVTIEFVAKETFMGQERKNEMEAPAVMAGPNGLVLTANSRLEGMMTMAMKMAGGMMGGMMPNMPKPQSDVEEIKVIIGDGSDEFEAKLVARDSDLDLAWVQIVDTKGRTFDYVDFNDWASLEVGDSYYTISRMGERFDRVPWSIPRAWWRRCRIRARSWSGPRPQPGVARCLPPRAWPPDSSSPSRPKKVNKDRCRSSP